MQMRPTEIDKMLVLTRKKCRNFGFIFWIGDRPIKKCVKFDVFNKSYLKKYFTDFETVFTLTFLMAAAI